MNQVLASFLGLALLFGSFGYAIFILKKLDSAAKKRQKSVGKTRIRFMILDFFSLILLIQVPFNFVDFEYFGLTAFFLLVISLSALLLVWFTTIKTVSHAGIVTFGWRALTSMILIPTMSTQEVVWLVVSFVGMVLSWWIANGAVAAGATPVSIESDTGTRDPFAD